AISPPIRVGVGGTASTKIGRASRKPSRRRPVCAGSSQCCWRSAIPGPGAKPPDRRACRAPRFLTRAPGRSPRTWMTTRAQARRSLVSHRLELAAEDLPQQGEELETRLGEQAQRPIAQTSFDETPQPLNETT